MLPSHLAPLSHNELPTFHSIHKSDLNFAQLPRKGLLGSFQGALRPPVPSSPSLLICHFIEDQVYIAATIYSTQMFAFIEQMMRQVANTTQCQIL